MASLRNYLRTQRKRHALTQAEAAFLVGANGLNQGIKVNREEGGSRIPSLETALAYEILYGVPVSELFAGLREEMIQQVKTRARLMQHQHGIMNQPKLQPFLNQLLARLTTFT